MQHIENDQAGDAIPSSGDQGPAAAADTAAETTANSADEGRALAAAPGPRLREQDMPTSFDISIVGSGGLDSILSGPRRDRRQPMRGFDHTYSDIVDYIVRITHRIWEEKDFGYIYDTYRAGVRVMGAGGPKDGRDQMLSESIAYSNAFPDLRLVAEEVIWAGDEDRGFHTSHRLREIGRNTGWSEWGAPTGRSISHLAIANCVVSENQIFEEWVLDNTAAMYQALGMDVLQLARTAADNVDINTLLGVAAGEVERLQGQGPPVALPAPDSFHPDRSVRYALHTIWNWRNLSAVDKFYSIGVRVHSATNRELYGRGDIKSFLTELLTMFPDLAHHVDEIYWQGNDRDGYLISVRWSVLGTHLGYGPYGPPSGRRVSFWGISQLAVRGGWVVEEWNVFTEFELIQQVLREDPVSPESQ